MSLPWVPTPSPDLSVYEPMSNYRIGQYPERVPKHHVDTIVDVYDKYGNLSSINLYPCVRVDNTHTLRQILDVRHSCLEQLKVREKNRRYWVKYGKNVVYMNIDDSWPVDVLNILEVYDKSKKLPIHVGKEYDLYHNRRGFEWNIENIVNADKWYNWAWRVYNLPPINKRTDEELTPYNLEFIHGFPTEEKAKWYINNMIEGAGYTPREYYDPYYLYYYEKYTETI
jgi:hypothetical protein